MNNVHVIPYLTVTDAPAAVSFYEQVFGAHEKGPRLTSPSGQILHTEMRIGDTAIMLSEHLPEYGSTDPRTLGGTPVRLALSVADADVTVSKAVAAGATVLLPVADQFYGHRAGRIEDPFGHVWIISHLVEALDENEMQRRLDEAFAD